MKAIFLAILGVCLYEAGAVPRRNGKGDGDGKIVGGQDTDIGRVPYQVSIQRYGSHFCGGSIITRRHILTAAHCMVYDPQTMSVRVGSSTYRSGGQLIQVKSGIKHPNYDTTAKVNDIAILELAEDVDFPRTGARRIQLAREEPKQGSMLLVSGWGATHEGSMASEHLKSVMLPVINREFCQRLYRETSTITHKQFCAGYREGGKDSCQGDSGGPGVINNIQYGVVSWGVGCARRGMAGVYTNVKEFIPWIKSHTNGLRD